MSRLEKIGIGVLVVFIVVVFLPVWIAMASTWLESMKWSVNTFGHMWEYSR